MPELDIMLGDPASRMISNGFWRILFVKDGDYRGYEVVSRVERSDWSYTLYQPYTSE